MRRGERHSSGRARGPAASVSTRARVRRRTPRPLRRSRITAEHRALPASASPAVGHAERGGRRPRPADGGSIAVRSLPGAGTAGPGRSTRYRWPATWSYANPRRVRPPVHVRGWLHGPGDAAVRAWSRRVPRLGAASRSPTDSRYLALRHPHSHMTATRPAATDSATRDGIWPTVTPTPGTRLATRRVPRTYQPPLTRRASRSICRTATCAGGHRAAADVVGFVRTGSADPGARAGVAQLAERQPSKLNVASSNLVSRSNSRFVLTATR